MMNCLCSTKVVVDFNASIGKKKMVGFSTRVDFVAEKWRELSSKI